MHRHASDVYMRMYETMLMFCRHWLAVNHVLVAFDTCLVHEQPRDRATQWLQAEPWRAPLTVNARSVSHCCAANSRCRGHSVNHHLIDGCCDPDWSD